MRPEGEAGGRVLVEVAATPGWLNISVEDNGIGLPGDGERDRLTEPYVTHKAKGTGLGLAIVKKIMEDHGGGLTLADGAEGGARATLTLPLDETPEQDGLQERGEMLRHGA
jgi:two-component system nitrogen regulation sensor histidine kinase NtrY